jgi:Spy/CpxP family protein refolding chaperone
MRFRTVIVLSAAALLCLASVAVSQQPGGRRPGGFSGAFGGTGRLSLVSIEAVQKELGLEPAQIEAIQKLRDELRPMRDGGKGRPGNRGKTKAPEASNRVPADWYFVQAQAQPGRFQPTPEQLEELRKQAAERTKLEKTKLAEILLPNQMKRLNEIYIQQLGTRAFEDVDVVAELKITDEQKASLAKVREESRAQMSELFAGGAGGDREARQAKLAEARKATEEKTLAVLTADQKTKFEELKGKPFEMPENAGRGPGGPGGAPGRRPAGNNSGE